MILIADSECSDQTARDAQADLGLRCPHMPEDTFSNDTAHIMNIWAETSESVHSNMCAFTQSDQNLP